MPSRNPPQARPCSVRPSSALCRGLGVPPTAITLLQGKRRRVGGLEGAAYPLAGAPPPRPGSARLFSGALSHPWGWGLWV